jgi:hypothetical protein
LTTRRNGNGKRVRARVEALMSSFSQMVNL